MRESAFSKVVAEICEKDRRYNAEAYFFVREALDFTSKILNKPSRGRDRHVTGSELLEGIQRHALQEFGPMALTVLNTWGIKATEDFGEIVFNLVASGTLGRTEEDRKEDFTNRYDFFDAFAKPFLPAIPPKSGKTEKTTRQQTIPRSTTPNAGSDQQTKDKRTHHTRHPKRGKGKQKDDKGNRT